MNVIWGERHGRKARAPMILTGAAVLAAIVGGHAIGGPTPAQANAASECDVQAQPASWTPDACEIASGGKVTWRFDNPPAGFAHDVWLIEPGEPADSPGFEVTSGPVPAGGASVAHDFDQLGTWTFVCKLHSFVSDGAWTGMVGTVDVVEPAPPRLSLQVKPKKRTVGPSAKQAAFSARVANTGGLATGPVRVCVKAPRKRLRVVGKACRSIANLGPGAARRETFKLRLTRAARGRTTKIVFVASGANVETRRAAAKLVARR